MTIKNIPAAPQARPRDGVRCDIAPSALERWNPSLMAEATDEDNTISIMDPIGFDIWGDGVTAKRIQQDLRAIGNQDVTVLINSPGGNVFEGLAIYNLLRQHKGHVTTKVIGLAASAASFIAQAGDDRQIARAAFLMVHNSWVCTCGNRHDLRAIADWLEPFDLTLADIYVARTGLALDQVTDALDAETWIGGSEAVKAGWCDNLFSGDYVHESADNRHTDTLAARKLDVILARAGVPRSERRALVHDLKTGTPSAAGTGTHDAADLAETAAVAELRALLDRLSPSQAA
tara:strand:- start:72 stop:938 length:867 start_codon:yes stop_codon:yes gene_type:complete